MLRESLDQKTRARTDEEAEEKSEAELPGDDRDDRAMAHPCHQRHGERDEPDAADEEDLLAPEAIGQAADDRHQHHHLREADAVEQQSARSWHARNLVQPGRGENEAE